MSVFQQPVKMDMLERGLIQCSRQTGKLRISRHACALRYLKAQEIKSEKCKTFGYGLFSARRWTLEICQTCPDGRRYAKEISALKFVKRKERIATWM